jgi:hypothetical protein
MPFFLAMMPFSLAFRIFEIVANINFKQRIFFMLWPLGLASTLAIYATVRPWGIWSVLTWPIIENIMRAGILFVVFHRDGIWRAFDPARSLLLVFCAGIILGALFVLREAIFFVDCVNVEFILATIGVAAFLGTLFVFRPFRPAEYEILSKMFPPSMAFLQRIVLMFTRT